MSTTIDRLRKRLKWPVKLGEETVYLRGATQGEIAESDPLDGVEKTWFLFGVALLDEDGTQAIARDGASPEVFAQRVKETLSDVTLDQLKLVSEALNKICTAPDLDKLKKS